MYELRSDAKKKPVAVECYEEAQAMICLCRYFYDRELVIEPETIPEEFDVELFRTYLTKHIPLHPVNGVLKPTMSVDLVILGKDLANFEQIDYAAVLQPYIDANQNLVEQYKSGNDKALNALMGKFLKDNKGHDAKAIKDTLESMLK